MNLMKWLWPISVFVGGDSENYERNLRFVDQAKILTGDLLSIKC
jgi:hypothetical protein